MDLLARDGGWRTATELAERLGVTPRSVRSYVAAVNDRLPGSVAIESGPQGYRARAEAIAALRSEDGEQTPRQRRRAIGRALVLADGGADVYDLAATHYVGDATIEADLGWVRAQAAERQLGWSRRGSVVALTGSESARRALLRVLLQDDETGYDQEAVAALFGSNAIEQIRVVRRELSARLGSAGYLVNEFALVGVAHAVAVAVWRSRDGHLVETAAPLEPDPLAAIVTRTATDVLDADLPAVEAAFLAEVLRVRGAAAIAGTAEETEIDGDAELTAQLREILDRTTTRFGVPRVADSVLVRLVAHVHHLRSRAGGGEWSRNPLTRTLKTSYPLLFDVAVSLATGLYERFGIPVHDDEVAYLAMHIGGQWERERSLENRLTATLVCPGYYEMHELLRSNIEQTLGSVLTITDVRTGMDPVETPGTDMVLTTIEKDASAGEVVHISPFFTDLDAERVMGAVARIRRGRRLSHLRAELGHWFVPSAFVRGLDPHEDEETVIRRLGALLIADGVIDADYIEAAVRRERASSTAFTETLAVPHGLGMTATRTAIAIAVSESSVPWGDGRVQVVALVAFSESDREAFQTVFDQFVEVFSDPAVVQTLVRRAVDFPSFLEQLAAVIEG